jgi:lactoylglutathione lyase
LVYLTLPGDDYELELTYNYDHAAYDLGDGYGHIAIRSEDIEALHADHKDKEFTITDMKGLPGTDPSYYFITDPDGYKIEVIR